MKQRPWNVVNVLYANAKHSGSRWQYTTHLSTLSAASAKTGDSLVSRSRTGKSPKRASYDAWSMRADVKSVVVGVLGLRSQYVRPATVSPLEQQTSKNLPSFSRIALPPASASMSTSSKPESASGDRCSSEPGSTRRSSDTSRPRKASGPINVRRGLSERSSEIRVTSSKAGTVARSRPAQSAARPPATSEHAQTSQIAPLFVGSRDQ
mmetsp:Transcript_16615/g.51736  ORF Transcript_16615/g.51736 Transcript_16615/m.51736 type:complete len:208 (-) Transcript_16615:1112-1735(-)